MIAFAPQVLLLLTLTLLAACAPEVKQPATAASQTAPGPSPEPAPPPPATSAPAPTPTSPAAPPRAGVQSRPAPTPEREDASKTPEAAPKRLIVNVARANLREKPDAKSHILQVLSKGTKVVVVSKGNQWYRVRLDNGREGWVAESVVTPSPD